MTTPTRLLLATLLPLALITTTAPVLRAEWHAHGGWEVCACKSHLRLGGGSGAPLDPDADTAGNGRQYARSREIDLRHVKLDLTPDFKKRSLAGVATLTFAPIGTPLRQLKLDAVDLRIAKVEASAAVEAWYANDRHVTITFTKAIDPDAEAEVTITYSAEPRDGWYFRTEAMGYPKGDDHFWTQGQPEKHRHWFPGYDYPNERFTSEVICRVPKGMTVVSNGALIKESVIGDQTLFHWKQEQEHVNYLISVVGGHFKRLEAKHGDLPMAFLTPPSEFAVAEHSFRDTPAILAFLEQETGVKFPWAKYYNICVSDFVAGGMENTSVTTLTTQTLFSPESENLRTSHRLDAHETAHQWFGDLLTCKDWSHLWLNEGFATFYTHLFDEHKFGVEEMRYRLWLDAQGILGNTDAKPIVWRGYRDPFEQFDYRAYPKGAWVLHMLRSQVGTDRYRQCITTYIERNRNRNVETHDLIDVFEELTGRSWDEFFDQWVFHGGEPSLKAAYSWDQAAGQAKLSIQQTQKVNENVMLFDFPLPVRFIDDRGVSHEFTIRVHDAAEDFYFSLPNKPEIVRLDPDLTVLAGIDFTPPAPMLMEQLQNPNDMLGRLLAVKSLGGKNDGQSLDGLKKALNGDAYYGVRIEAARALAKTHTPEALAALIDSQKQDDARAREEVTSAIGKFYSASAFAALRAIAAKERNPDIAADAIGALGKFLQDESRAILLAALDRPSYRHRVGSAAIQALRTRGGVETVPVLKEHLIRNESIFVSQDFGRGLDALAYLARQQPDDAREETRRFIAGYLEHPKSTVRRGAIGALGTLEDPRSLGALRTFVEAGNPDLPESKAADEAIKKLNAAKPQADEVKDLRRELMELQSEIKTLKEGLNAVRKQATAPEANSSKSKSSNK